MSRGQKYYYRQVLVTVFMLIFFVFFSCAESEPFPEYLKGKWFTDEMLYDDRYIQIGETQIILGTGQVEPSMFFIQHYQSKKNGRAVEWRFECELASGDEYTLFIIYHPDEAYGWIQLKNTPRVQWYKIEES